MDIEQFTERIANWCEQESDVIAAALVGSYARDEARPDSDVDIIILANDPEPFVRNPKWLASFDLPSSPILEDWGEITSLRIRHSGGPEIEFGFGKRSWASLPPDPGTQRVVTDGMRIIYDPSDLLQDLQDCVQTFA